MPIRVVVRAARRTVAPRAHAVLDRVHRRGGERAFQQAFAQARAAGVVRINVGAGRRPLPGWVNTDVVRQGRLYLEATKTWPVPAGSVDLVYADNMIEHLTLAQGRELLGHAYAALRPGGMLRLATPDVEAVARQYLDNGELARLGMERNAEVGHPMTHPVELIRQVYVGAKPG